MLRRGPERWERAGAVVSIVTERTALAGLVLPATSIAFAVIAWVPCASALDVIVQ